MLRSDTRAMGRVLDVVWYDLTLQKQRVGYNGSFFWMLRSDTRAMGRVLDVV